MKHKTAGFTLIELMVVVAIVGILAAVAYPSYTESVNKGRRAECKSAILQTANRLERFFTTNNTYSSDFTLIGGNSFSGNDVASSACTLTVAAENATDGLARGFSITGTPRRADVRCGNLTYNHRGEKGLSGTQSVAYCW